MSVFTRQIFVRFRDIGDFPLFGVVQQFLPVRKATAYKLTASEIGPAFKKLPGDCGPPRVAAIHWRMLGETSPGAGCRGAGAFGI